MFEGFETRRVSGAGAEVFIRIGGNVQNPPLVLLHGYPQTSAMWHLVAPLLTDEFQVFCPDLRGYGQSGKPGCRNPGSDISHELYSKRAMAADIVAAMNGLGHDRFYLAGHDRGGRVAHRLGMDFPELCPAISVLDIAPTREMYAGTDAGFATAYWHWFFLIQPYPQPERIIEADPDTFWLGKNLANAGGKNSFESEALEEYLAAFRDPAVIHSSCEDYRAAATIDIEHDNADEDRRLAMPLQVLWAKDRVIDRFFNPLEEWKKRADHVEGQPVVGTHYVAEEDPATIADLYRQFFSKHSF